MSVDDKKSEREEVVVDFNNIRYYKFNIFLWGLYDLANTIYSMGIVSLVILPLITIVAIASVSGIDPYTLIDNSVTVSEEEFVQGANLANGLFFMVVLVGNIFMIIASPILGAYADQLTKRKFLLVLISAFCLLFIYLITSQLSLMWILIAFLLANVTYQMSLIVYDSMIPFLSKPEHTSQASGFGIAFGYFGSFIAIGIADYMSGENNAYILNEELFEIKIGYIVQYVPIVAIAFLLLGFPIIFTQEARSKSAKKTVGELVNETFASLRITLSEVWKVDDSKYFMIGWLLFVDTANVVILYMSTLVTVGLGMPTDAVFTILGIGIASAVVFTYPVGWLGDKIGPKKLFKVVGALWLAALYFGAVTNYTFGSFTVPESFSLIMAVLVGPALGGTWVAQRQMITQLAPKERTSNYFGIANIFGRISSIIGPGIVTVTFFILTNFVHLGAGVSYRIIMVVLSFILIIGMIFIAKVTDHHKDYLSGYRHVGDGEWSKD